MKQKLNLYYDEEGDFLEIHFGEYKKGHFKNLGDGLFERIDKETNKVTGAAIMGFRKRTEDRKAVTLPLPFSVEYDEA